MEKSVIRFPAQFWPFLRTMWYFWAVAYLGILILNVPSQLDTIAVIVQGGPTAATSRIAAAANLATVLAQSAGSLISLVLAGVLYLKKPADGMALFLSYFLLVIGIVMLPFYALEPIWAGATSFKYGVVQPLIFGPFLIAFLASFPNGRLVPAWTRLLLVTAVIYAPVGPFLFTPEAYSNPTPIFVTGILVWFAIIFTGFFAQIYRYRYLSDPIERQQTKWVIYGFTLSAIFVFLATIWTILSNSLPKGTSLPWWSPIINLSTVLPLPYVVLPITLTVAVMRYRLYDIDIIISRTLVYGALTASVAGLYFLVVGSLGAFFQAQGNLTIALLATGIVALLFQPLRERLQREVNRLIYGERDDPIETLSRLGKQLESAVPPDAVLPMLVETIARTLKLPYVGIHLTGETQETTAAEYGALLQEPVTLPLTYQGKNIGRLDVAPRNHSSSFSLAEMRLLQNIAHQAGPAAYAMQLTEALRQSRVRLVTAREEERRRLRRDLHDGLGPILASQGLKMAAVAELGQDDPVRVRLLLEELMAQNASTVTEIRRLVYELRPPALDDLGLVAAVRDYATGFKGDTEHSSRPRADVRAPADGLPALSAAIEVAAYRIATEALTNVAHHARARHASVSFTVNAANHDQRLHLEIVDDGIGLRQSQRSGVGLISMRERAEEVGGHLLIESTPGQGTRVVAELPLVEVI